ncbi:uncharacterized protein LOC144321266 isoform X1 [Canis aureus]
MGTEAPAPQGRGWLVALLWLLLLSAGTPGSWPVTSQTPAPAPDQAAAQEPGRPAGGTQRLAPGAVCGKPKVTGRIFGGRNVLAGQWPWQASLLYQRSHLCGAVLIDSLWLVSTAHCFLNKSHDPADYQVLLGSTQLYQHTQHTQEISLSRIIVHPDFEKRHPFGSDIVMLQLHLPLNFTPYIAPACLPSPDMQLSGNLSCWITGWGMLSEDSEGSSCTRPSACRRGRWASSGTSSVTSYTDKDLARARPTLCRTRCCAPGTSRQGRPSARVIPGAPSSASSPRPGFSWGWPAGALTAATPSTPASSPGLATSPTGSMRSRCSHLPLIPHLLLRPRFRASLCRRPAPLGTLQPLCLPRPGSCCCVHSETPSRPCSDPSPLAPASCLPRAPVWSPEPSTPPHFSPTGSQQFPLLYFPTHQLPPTKPSQKKNKKTKKNKRLILFLSWDHTAPSLEVRHVAPSARKGDWSGDLPQMELGLPAGK